MSRRGERGQATVEFAILLPSVMIVVLVLLQILLVARDATSLTSATRAAARAALVGDDLDSVRDAARNESRLDPARLTITVSGGSASGDLATVRATYRAPTNVPLVGSFVDDVVLTERFVVRIE